jgi:5'-deoxynucleotidase YfbR-like HD superfamily hydrolase
MSWRDVIAASSGHIRRLADAWRFGTIPKLINENVADHSYYVCLYALLIHNEIYQDKDHDSKLISAILVKALVHDGVESITGELIRTFKYSSPELKQAIDDAENKLIDEFEYPVRQLFYLSEKLKLETDEEYIEDVVKAADFMSLFQYMRREILRGNDEIGPFYRRMIADIEMMADKFKLTTSSRITERRKKYKYDLYDYYLDLRKEALMLHGEE